MSTVGVSGDTKSLEGMLEKSKVERANPAGILSKH